MVYKSILLEQSDFPEARERYFHTLRRWLQTRRHFNDSTYNKEVLALRYSQAMKLYEFLLVYLRENSLDHDQLSAARLFRKGLEEFEFALANPAFVRKHLPRASKTEIKAFRSSLLALWGNRPIVNSQDAANRVRAIAKAAGDKLQLELTVTVMEFTCGSCYAVDDYTMYLTPMQLQRLCQTFKGRVDGSNVNYKVIDFEGDAIGYIGVHDFSETTLPDIDAALMYLSKKGVKALVLDLRDNHGGLVDAAVDIARRFLSSGIIVTVHSQHTKTPIVYQSRNPESVTIPMVVLVNSGTASAAEILAGALKENGRGRLVGQTTFGKGCIQDLYQLVPKYGKAYPGGLLMTVSRFYSPNGNPYAGKGVMPHVESPNGPKPISLSNSDDPVLRDGLLEAQRLIME